ncbi:hypothetical protein RI129_009916 [Pyrocoelia pectoralis]|uniref:Cytochrome P450 n=1 Tax=Pyrocoelia pectoralis TaxID=417401 RepID=A0AAN7VCH7_9COLE
MVLYIVTSCLTLSILGIMWLILKIYTIYNYWKERNVYTWTPHFLFGNSKDAVLQRIPLGFDVTALYHDLKSRSAKYGGYYSFLTPVFIPVDLDLIKKILISNSDCFVDRVSYVDEQNDPLSVNLLHAHGETWKRFRAKISPSFSNSKIKTFLPIMMAKNRDLIRLIEETVKKAEPLNVKEVLDRYTIDVVGLYTCGTDLGTLTCKDSELKHQLAEFFNTSAVNSLIRFLITAPKILKYLKIMTFTKKVTKFFMTLINDIIQNRNQNESRGTVALDILMKAERTDSSGEKFTRSEIVSNIAILLLAGYETTSNALTFCLYELASDVTLQETLRSEINTLDSNPSYDDIASLSLLNKCVNETLRKYPLGTVYTRECTKTFHVPNSNIILEKGAHVYIPIRGIQWDPEYFPDPETFNPERFSKEHISERHPCMWFPFGLGPRHCVGEKFGFITIKIVLVNLLKTYKFFLHPKTQSPLRYDVNAFVLQAENGVFLNVEKIEVPT